MSEIFFDLRNVSTKGNRPLEGISLAVQEKEVVCIIGNAGAGKSTLLELIGGIIPYNSGELFFCGKEFNSMGSQEMLEFRFKLGFVFQHAALWANQSIFDNIALPLRIQDRNASRKSIEASVERVSELVGYRGDLFARPFQLSSGQKKLIGFARAIVHNPEILIMDEPFTDLDADSMDRLASLVTTLKQNGKTIVLSTVYSKIVSRCADRICILQDGRLLADGNRIQALSWKDPVLRTFVDRLELTGYTVFPWELTAAGTWADAMASEEELDVSIIADEEIAGPKLGEIINDITDPSEIYESPANKDKA